MSTAETLKELLEDHQKFHSSFQIDNFILERAGGTPYGRYKQSLREMRTRWDALKREWIQLRRLEESIDPDGNTLDQLEIMMKIDTLQATVKDRIRELERFYSHAKALKKHIGVIDEERRQQLEEDFWEFHTKRTMALDFITEGRLRRGTAELVASLPEKVKIKVLPFRKNAAFCVDWYEAYKPDPIEIPMVTLEEDKLKELAQ